MLETEKVSSSYNKNSIQNFTSEISGRALHYCISLLCISSKILTKTLNLHLSITVGQQYNAFEQFEVMKPYASLQHLQKLTITLT